jgi:hypothetical protein
MSKVSEIVAIHQGTSDCGMHGSPSQCPGPLFQIPTKAHNVRHFTQGPTKVVCKTPYIRTCCDSAVDKNLPWMSRRIDAVIKILNTRLTTTPSLNALGRSRPTFQARTIQACIKACKTVSGLANAAHYKWTFGQQLQMMACHERSCSIASYNASF